MPLYTTKGIVLQSQEFSEADKIVTLYTQKFGKIRGIAKGAKKPTSKFGSVVEIFTYADYLLYGKENKDLDIISQGQIIQSFQEIREDLDKITTGAFILEVVDSLVVGREKDPLLFNLILQTLTWLKSEVNELIIPTFVLKIMTILGTKPNVCESCLLCNKVISNDKMQFSPAQGGIVCISHKIEDGIILSNETRRIIEHLLILDISRIRKIQVAKNLLLDIKELVIHYLNYHLPKPLKSVKTLNLCQYFSNDYSSFK